jgi:hypothetical protein
MDTQTLELLDACRLDMEPTGAATPTYLAFMADHGRWMALDHVMKEAGLNETQMKFCFWLEDDMKRIEQELFGRKGKQNGKSRVIETHDEWGDKINAANMTMSEEIANNKRLDQIHNLEGYVSDLVRHGGYRAEGWLQRKQREEAEALRVAHASTKDAIRMRERRAAGKVKPRPPRPPRSLAQKVEDRSKMVETRLAKIEAFKNNAGLHNMSMGDLKSAQAKAAKSLRSAQRALETAEKKLAESQVKPD